ncbi:MAG: PD-(D/E)XK nuclease family protein [Chloroflexi bacterium]|nr:PD-(D/E)XK nuclease family protein [Chloroflexota bacterium]
MVGHSLNGLIYMHEDELQKIQELITGLSGDSDHFAEKLRSERIGHLSFSQVTTVEFCEYRYFLQYVERREPSPTPDYFTKGKLFHEAVSLFYKEIKKGNFPEGYPALAGHYQGENQRHLENAYRVHLENHWHHCEVVAVEHPFVMEVGADLLPLVGVIDLIAKMDDTYIIVDHKTGRNFYPPDELQMAIYVEYIRRRYGSVKCEFYYDHYRWVNNLARIRKPAFQRDNVAIGSDSWEGALTRIKKGQKQIERIRSTERASRNGECFMCPYKNDCYR